MKISLEALCRCHKQPNVQLFAVNIDQNSTRSNTRLRCYLFFHLLCSTTPSLRDLFWVRPEKDTEIWRNHWSSIEAYWSRNASLHVAQSSSLQYICSQIDGKSIVVTTAAGSSPPSVGHATDVSAHRLYHDSCSEMCAPRSMTKTSMMMTCSMAIIR